MTTKQEAAHQLLQNVIVQLNGFYQTNQREDQSGFECRLTQDRAVDMIVRAAEIYHVSL